MRSLGIRKGESLDIQIELDHLGGLARDAGEIQEDGGLAENIEVPFKPDFICCLCWTQVRQAQSRRDDAYSA